MSAYLEPLLLAQPRIFTVEEYHRLGQVGILREDDRVELIRGRIVQMSPIGSPHYGCVAALTRLFAERCDARFVLGVRGPITLPHSEPEPDIALLRPRDDDYRAALPTPDDVLLLIEVADSSERYDREIKVPLYAEVGIRETWLVCLTRSHVEVYRAPEAGRYRQTATAHRGDRLTVSSVPEVTVTVDEILG